MARVLQRDGEVLPRAGGERRHARVVEVLLAAAPRIEVVLAAGLVRPLEAVARRDEPIARAHHHLIIVPFEGWTHWIHRLKVPAVAVAESDALAGVSR